MTQKTGIGVLFYVLILMSIISGCRKSDEPVPEPVDGTLHIRFGWDTLPEGMQSFEGMMLRFYPESGEGTVYEMKSDTTSFSGSLPIGSYRVLIYNSPTPSIWFRGQEQFDTTEAYVLPQSRAATTVEQPDWFLLASLSHCEVTEKDASLQISPEPVVRRISLRINVTDLRQVKSVSGLLLNVADAVRLSTGQPVATSFVGTDIPISREGQLFNGSLLVFNLLNKNDIPGGGADKNLRLQINYTDNTSEVHELDIYDDLSNLGNGDSAEIDLDVTPSGVRFQVHITEWQEGKGPDVPVEK